MKTCKCSLITCCSIHYSWSQSRDLPNALFTDDCYKASDGWRRKIERSCVPLSILSFFTSSSLPLLKTSCYMKQTVIFQVAICYAFSCLKANALPNNKDNMHF